MNKDVKAMTDEELDEAIEKKYGAGWDLAVIIKSKPLDKLIEEYIYRIGCGEHTEE